MPLFLAEINEQKATLMDKCKNLYHPNDISKNVHSIDFFSNYFEAKAEADEYGTGRVAMVDCIARIATMENKMVDQTTKAGE